MGKYSKLKRHFEMFYLKEVVYFNICSTIVLIKKTWFSNNMYGNMVMCGVHVRYTCIWDPS